jgi:hypothetical protein
VRFVACLLVGLVGCGGAAFSVTSATDGGAVDASVNDASGADGPADSSVSEAGNAADAGDAESGTESGVEAGPAEAGSPEGGSADAGSGVACGLQLSCSAPTPDCCIATGGQPDTCTKATCPACETQLACAADRDCSGLTGQCCIGKVTNGAACTAGQFASRCATACTAGESHLCDPSNPSTLPCLGAQCSTALADLQAVGLPGPPYGVCK